MSASHECAVVVGGIELDPDAFDVDLDAYIAACGEHHRIMGLYFYTLYRALMRHGARRGAASWHPFELYPLGDYHRLVRAVCATVYASESTAWALYYLGVDSMRSFLQTSLGRLIYRRRSVAEALSRLYHGHTLQAGSVEVVGHGAHHAQLLVRDVPLSPMSYFGALSELARWLEPDVQLRAWLGPEAALCDYRLHLAW